MINESHQTSEQYEKAEGGISNEYRLGFIKKVYGILSAQLIFTALFTLGCMQLSDESKAAFFLNPVILVTVITTYICSICALVCCGMHRKVPTNYILLAIFTLCVSFIVASVSCRYNQILVFEAAALTSAVVVGVTVYAYTTKTDFTVCGPIMFIFGMLFVTASILFVCLRGQKGFQQAHFGFAVLGAFLFSFYLLCDTQMILGGKNRRYTISEEDYILAAVILYLDIINLFLEILKALGNR